MTDRCSMTGNIINDSGDGVWDDGEWISWEWIDSQIQENDSDEEDEYEELEIDELSDKKDLIRVFEQILAAAKEYKYVTGRYLPALGELGEIYAEFTYGVKRHKARTEGSDGFLGKELVEIKTITPEKTKEMVSVKTSGDFTKLIVVKMDENFEFESRILDRSLISEGVGKLAIVKWSVMKTSSDKWLSDSDNTEEK